MFKLLKFFAGGMTIQQGLILLGLFALYTGGVGAAAGLKGYSLGKAAQLSVDLQKITDAKAETENVKQQVIAANNRIDEANRNWRSIYDAAEKQRQEELAKVNEEKADAESKVLAYEIELQKTGDTQCILSPSDAKRLRE